MSPTISEIEDKLNRYYSIDYMLYISYLIGIKKLGYRVFRNSNGIHKVVKNTDSLAYLKKMFGMEDWSEQRF